VAKPEYGKNRDDVNTETPEGELYASAQEIEHKSEAFYRDQAEKIQDPALKLQILQVADEEHKHMLLMIDLVEYANRPNDWVEHAMFGLREEY
jgi:rubrerythrin